MKTRVTFAAALLMSFSALTARAWDNTKTHPAQTETALKYADVDGSVTKYFSDQFAISSTSIALLPVVIGFEPDGVDGDIEGPFSRLNCSLNETDAICADGTAARDRIPTLSEVGCDVSSDCTRYGVDRLLRAGSFAEDNPNPRAQHHFLDPDAADPNSQGLEDTAYLPVIDVLLAELATGTLRGRNLLRMVSGIVTAPLVSNPFKPVHLDVGNFDLRGRSALGRVGWKTTPSDRTRSRSSTGSTSSSERSATRPPRALQLMERNLRELSRSVLLLVRRQRRRVPKPQPRKTAQSPSWRGRERLRGERSESGDASPGVSRASGGRNMADPRLLTRWLALALVACALSACAIGPIWARRLEGRVVDAGTGQPVPGVEVFASYLAVALLTPSSVDFDYHFTTTDAQGHFAIAGHFASQAWRWLHWTRSKPNVWLLHRSYGDLLYEYSTASQGLPADWQSLELRIRPNEDSLRVLSKPENAGDLGPCLSYDPDACRRACVVWWGSLDVCEQYGVVPRARP